MYLLYLDEAGDAKNRSEKNFVLAGIAVFERQAYWLQNELEQLVAGLAHPEPERFELHGNQIFAGRGWWRGIRSRDKRCAVISGGLSIAKALPPNQWRLFGAVVDKQSRAPEDPVEYAFEQICNRFDLFLRRLHRQGYPQQGLIVLDKSTQETRLQSLASEFRNYGHRWGSMHSLADVPFFVDSKATRGIQYADLVAYAIWRKYEKGDDQFFNVIAGSFDREGGIVHGLHHFRNLADPCDCPGCAPRFI